MKPKKVKETCEQVSLWDFEGKLEKIAERVNRLIEQYGADAELSYGQYDRWDDGYSFLVTKLRDETAEERKLRLAKEKEDQEKREAAEREQLKRLAAKYGNPSDN